MVRRFYSQQLGYKRRDEGDHFIELHTIGIDLGKTIFHLVGLDSRGQVVVRKRFSRPQRFCWGMQGRMAIVELTPEVRRSERLVHWATTLSR
jgi:hypothetical protein